MATPTEMLNQAYQHLSAGDMNQAEALCHRILENTPHFSNAVQLLGILALQRRQFEQAISCFQQAIEITPQEPSNYSNLGLALTAMGRHEEALAMLNQALALSPDFADAHFNLGNLLMDMGRLQEAVAEFQKTLSIQPGYLNALHNLGSAYQNMGEAEAARECFENTVQQNPRFLSAWNNLGIALRDLGRYDESKVCFETILQHQPDFISAWVNLGNHYMALGQWANAVDTYRQGMQYGPMQPHVYLNMGQALLSMEQFDEGRRMFEKAVEVAPGFAESYSVLGNLLVNLCEFEQAQAYFRRAYELNPERRIWLLRAETACPAIYSSQAQIDSLRQANLTILNQLQGQPLGLVPFDLMAGRYEPSCFLSYQGENDLEIKSRFADLFDAEFQDGPFVGLREPTAPSNARLKIGFLVSQRNEAIFCKAMSGLLDSLNSEIFDVSIICPQPGIDFVRPRLKNQQVSFIPLLNRFENAVRHIKAQALDILFYFEIGTDSLNYFMPFFRPAPVQVTSCWGFPVTSGNPYVDAFLSSDWVEVEDAQDHYREKLIRLKTMPVYFKRPPMPGTFKSRAELGLPETAHLYFCCQSLFKLHPDFDPILADLLARDPQGKLVLFESHYRHQTEFIRARLAQRIPDVPERVLIFPRQTHEDFMQLLNQADVVLDTPKISGGVTSFEALALGLPVVTMPTPFMRSRMTTACYRRIGVEDCIVETPEQYVDLALKLAQDRDYRQDIRDRILASNAVLYEDQDVVAAYESALINLVKHTR